MRRTNHLATALCYYQNSRGNLTGRDHNHSMNQGRTVGLLLDQRRLTRLHIFTWIVSKVIWSPHTSSKTGHWNLSRIDNSRPSSLLYNLENDEQLCWKVSRYSSSEIIQVTRIREFLLVRSFIRLCVEGMYFATNCCIVNVCGAFASLAYERGFIIQRIAQVPWSESRWCIWLFETKGDTAQRIAA